MTRLPNIFARMWMLSVMVAAVITMTLAPAQAEQTRWQEQSIGLSLQPPDDAQLQPLATDTAVLRIVHDRYVIEVSIIRDSPTEMDIDSLMEISLKQLSLAGNELDRKKITVNENTAGIVYVHSVKGGNEPWVHGQAIMLVDPYTYVVLQLNTPAKHIEQIQSVFEAVVQSMALATIEDLEAQARLRKEQVERGDAWRRAINAQQLHAAIISSQLFRIIDQNSDVGYMTINQTRVQPGKSTQWSEPGIAVNVQSRLYLPDQTVQDTQQQCYLSDDFESEFWLHKSTARRLDVDVAAAGDKKRWTEEGKKVIFDPTLTQRRNIDIVESRNETGVRDRLNANGVRQVGSAIDEFSWTQPPIGYLSQVELSLIGSLLKGHDGQVLGFYVYDPSVEKIMMRTFRVVHAPDGTMRLYTRFRPDMAEAVSEYDAQGKLLRVALGGGRVLLATTPEQLKQIWKLK